MNYEDRLKNIIGNDDWYWFEKINKFIDANFENKNLGIIQIENLAKDKEAFNEFTKILNHTKDEDLKNIVNNIKGFDLSFKYSQEELKAIFYHQMTEDEFKKIENLNLNDIISKIKTDKYQIKYINDIGFILIGEGYLILANREKSTHYFANIFTDAEYFKKKIIDTYKKRYPENNN